LEGETHLIAQISAGLMDEGEFHYRNYAPGFALARLPGVFVVGASPRHRLIEELLNAADIAVLHMVYDVELLPLIEDRRKQGGVTVYEISDDIDAATGWPPLDTSFATCRADMKRLAGACDAMQFPSEFLRDKYAHLNRFSEVFPNQMLIVPPEKGLRRSSEIVVGWGGSLTHLEDLAEIAGPLIRWISSRSDIRLHLMAADPIWALFDSLSSDKKKKFETGSILDYYHFLDSLDVGVGPLRDTPFNRARTDIKFLEYAARCVVAVMQATGPYRESVSQGVNGYLYKNTGELVDILETVTSDLRLRVRIATAARNYVMSERHQFHHAGKRLDFYLKIMGERRIVPGSGLFGRLSQMKGALVQGRYLMLQPGS